MPFSKAAAKSTGTNNPCSLWIIQGIGLLPPFAPERKVLPKGRLAAAGRAGGRPKEGLPAAGHKSIPLPCAAPPPERHRPHLQRAGELFRIEQRAAAALCFPKAVFLVLRCLIQIVIFVLNYTNPIFLVSTFFASLFYYLYCFYEFIQFPHPSFPFKQGAWCRKEKQPAPLPRVAGRAADCSF